ncbi:MAG: hypothetical protein AAFU65_06470, partial [Pseudomonadota bacterium]
LFGTRDAHVRQAAFFQQPVALGVLVMRQAAKKRLTLTFAAGRKRYGEQQDIEHSRFLSELPEELLEWDGEKKEVDEESRQRTGAMALAELRGLLSG